MKRIIKTPEKIAYVAKPLEFLTESGPDKTEGEAIIAEIKEVMEKHLEIPALAAQQIGIDARIFCIRFSDTIKTFINPIITKKSGSVIAPETFTSMPGKEILISRPEELTVVYYTDEFKYEDNKLMGLAARIFDQMGQLLDGILPSDLGLVSDIETDGSIGDLSDEDFNELAAVYKQFVKVKTDALKKEMEADKTLSKQFKELSFTESVINGRTLLVDEGQPMNREQRRAAAKKNRKFSKINTKVGE